jgi:putative transcriptional regulator
MTAHHPQDDLLMSYGAGALGESWSLAVATHLAYCPACRQKVEAAESVGGVILEDVTPEPLSSNALSAVLSKLDDPIEVKSVPTQPPISSALPQPLRNYIGDDIEKIAWKSIGGGAYQFLISTGDNDQARLLRIPGGKPVPEHGHRGREVTLVLKGSFSDQNGNYQSGDLEDVDESMTHQPLAGGDQDCICLAVTDASLKFKDLIPRLAQTFIRI